MSPWQYSPSSRLSAHHHWFWHCKIGAGHADWERENSKFDGCVGLCRVTEQGIISPCAQATRAKRESTQHPMFPGPLGSQYWSGSAQLSFRIRNGTGRFLRDMAVCMGQFYWHHVGLVYIRSGQRLMKASHLFIMRNGLKISTVTSSLHSHTIAFISYLTRFQCRYCRRTGW